MSTRLTLAAIGPVLATMVAGCVAIDNRARYEVIAKEETTKLSARFANRATYVSKRAVDDYGNFAWLIDQTDATTASVIAFSLDEDGLKIRFETGGGSVVATRTYRFQDGLELTPEGKIQLPSASGVGSGGPGVALATRSTTLFVNQKGELVTTNHMTAAGILGIFPFGAHSQFVAIFPRDPRH